MASKSEHISETRQVISDFIKCLNRARSLKREFDALGYQNATTGLVDADFPDTLDPITAPQFKQAVAALEEFNAVFTAGGTITANNDAKLYRVVKGARF